MTSRTFGAAALAAGMMGIAAISAAPAFANTETQAAGKNEGTTCYLLGCYDSDGNKVEKPDQTKTGSIAKDAGAAVAAVKKGAGGAKFHTIVARHASAHGVPLELAHAVIRIESNYRQNARGAAGEVGLMQIKPATARMMGYSGSTKALYDPETNIRYGMKYLAMAQQLGDGSVCGTILKYNAGHAAKRMNRISAAYCSKVKRHMAGA